MASAKAEQEKALALLKKIQETGSARSFSAAIQAQTTQAFSFATSFDIETGDLKRTSPIYELGFLHEGKPAVNVFGRPTEISGGRQAAFSPFTKRQIADRFGSLFDARATFNQEGLRQRDIPRFALNQLQGRDVWVQNLPFERSFLSARMEKGQFSTWAKSARMESFVGDSGLYSTSPGLKKALHQASLNQSRLSSLDKYLGSWAGVFDEFHKSLSGPRPEGVTRVFDLMDLTRSVFAMAQTRDLMPKTGELFAGSSVEALSQAIFKVPEPHSALGDAVLQSEIAKYMYATGLSLKEGGVSDHQRQFFRQIGSVQQGIKQEGATKNIIDTFVAQQKYHISHDLDDLAPATVGAETRIGRGNLQVLQPDGSYQQEPFEYSYRHRGDSSRLTTSLDDFIQSRATEQSRRHGIDVDYDAAHKEARRLYIDKYERTVAELGGDRGKALGATGDALAGAGETIKERVRTLLQKEAPQPGLKEAITSRWKLGVGILAGVALFGHLFSGKDDEYNYIEGLRHTGFSGESRALNTDFGSGWRGLIGFSARLGEDLTPRKEASLEILGFVTSSRASDKSGFYSRVPSTIQSEMDRSVAARQEYPVFINRDAFIERENRFRDVSGALAGISSMERGAQAALGGGRWRRLFNRGQIAQSEARIQSLRDTQADLVTPGESIKATILHERFHQRVQNDVDAYREVKQAVVPEEFSQIFRDVQYGPESSIAEEFLAHKKQYERYPRTLRNSPFRSVFENTGRPQSNTQGNTVRGLPEQGVAGATRKNNTNFGSPWQGQGHIDDENAARLSKRHAVGLNPNFQGSVGIRDIPSFRVEDADTVQAMFLIGSNVNLRLAGIDAPETEHGGLLGRVAQGQPFGEEATARLREILGQQENVQAVFDPNAEGTYGRAPAILFGDDGLNINLQLVREGMAAALPFGAASERIFDTNEFRKAQREAQEEGLGMWADEGWQSVYRAQSQAKTKLTHTSLTQPERIVENFRTAASAIRLQNPDEDISGMMAGGGKDDFNIIEGLRHGWAQGNRALNIGDFGSGYIIDKTVNVMKKSTKVKRDLMRGQALARSQCRAMMDPENWTKHHIG